MPVSPPTDSQINAAAKFIRDRWNQKPGFAIILGTGAGNLADQISIDETIPYEELPHFPRSTAMGHKGQWICGRLAGQPVVAMQGRFHLYEGHPFDWATFPLHVMQQLGVSTLFVSNASGGINPKFASGEIMLIDSHIDLMCRNSLRPAQQTEHQRPLVRSDFYDSALIERALACARRNNFSLHRGVYAAMLGPNYETRAEYRFLKRIGADVAGMSTVPEVTVASQFGMRILGLSIITNVAKPDVLAATSGQEVIDAAETAGPHLQKIVIDAIEFLS